jgi:hypothetical protein
MNAHRLRETRRPTNPEWFKVTKHGLGAKGASHEPAIKPSQRIQSVQRIEFSIQERFEFFGKPLWFMGCGQVRKDQAASYERNPVRSGEFIPQLFYACPIPAE